MSEIWGVNSSPIIVLCAINQAMLLEKLAERLLIPQAVAKEIADGPKDDNAKRWLRSDGSSYIESDSFVDIEIAAWDLGNGESEVLSICRKNDKCVGIIDDLAARKCAAAFSIRVKGTLSVLMLAKRMNILSEIKPAIIQLQENGFRISDKLVTILLREAGE